jgi:RNA polymerase-binding transcription factor DksA
MLDEQTKSRLRKQLEEQRDELRALLEQQQQDVRELTADEVNENTYSNHFDDPAGDLEEIERISGVQDNSQRLLEQVEAALRRMDEGTYGLSEVSGKEIPVERLEAIPYATKLVEEEATEEANTLIDTHTPGSPFLHEEQE